MGKPEHYSRDIATRCQFLIERLLPLVRNGLEGDRAHGGPVSTTFLLAAGTPMIVLPMERLFKSGSLDTGHDAHLDETLTKDVRQTLGRPFGETPFGCIGGWSFVEVRPYFNIAEDWDPALLRALNEPEAFEIATRLPASKILCILRNALAHGGITYLGKDGHNTAGPAAMIAFASTIRTSKDEGGQIVGLNILRGGEDTFVGFLSAWANWLNKHRVSKLLNDGVKFGDLGHAANLFAQ